MSLRHIAIPSSRSRARSTLPSSPLPPRYPTYALATRVQSKLQQDLLAWKALPPGAPHHKPPPRPALISFTPAPTYTLGRRQTEPLAASELARLRAPLHISASSHGKSFGYTPEVLHAPRGGLTTYHGPGQVVLWPVIDLRSPLHAHFSVRDYTCLLEKTTIATLQRVYGIEGFTTSNPGVWVRLRSTSLTSEQQDTEEGEERKIAALGVHLRRHVTGLGVAINFGMPVSGSEAVNPWARIVACGLGDKSVTSVMAHLDLSPVLNGDDIAPVWAAEFAARLNLHVPEGEDGGPVVEDGFWEHWEKELQIDRLDEGFVEAQMLLG
ncbi:hypothetical protein F4677DRAFT_298873 [Hypoxylon crocopeplum]|nr:hypothetical protein F4677DRAFT_298873 [Hypoxylon crocopeplum]